MHGDPLAEGGMIGKGVELVTAGDMLGIGGEIIKAASRPISFGP